MSLQTADEERLLREKVERSESALADLKAELREADAHLDGLAQIKHQYDALGQVCSLLNGLRDSGAEHLFWIGNTASSDAADQLWSARQKIERYSEEIVRVEERRLSIIDRIGEHDATLDYLHYDLQDAIEREEARKNQWVVEREAEPLLPRAQVMPWARGAEEDVRARKSVGASLAISFGLSLLISSIALPMMKTPTINELPERIARLVRQDRQPPPPPVVEPVNPEQLAEPDPEVPKVAEEVPPTELPNSTEEPAIANIKMPEDALPPSPKGILAFRDSLKSAASVRPASQLGSQARVSSAGENAVGRPERMMVASSASGSSGGINLSDISRNVGGGGGQGIEGVEVSRVTSSIGGGSGPNRPLSGGAAAGRTDEEIQIVFDRYKASLYRLYNRELRKDPTLRGQLVLRLTIEPDGSVSLCELHMSDMDAPDLAQQVVVRVQGFAFGAKDVASMTIIYPIDFLPSG